MNQQRDGTGICVLGRKTIYVGLCLSRGGGAYQYLSPVFSS